MSTEPEDHSRPSYRPGGPVFPRRRNPSGPSAIPRPSFKNRLWARLHYRDTGNLRPLGFVVAYLIAGLMVLVFFVLMSWLRMTLWPPTPRNITVKLDGTYIVIPECSELDDLGYDGVASCIDADGRIVTVGQGG